MSTLGKNSRSDGENPKINYRREISQEVIVEFIRKVRHFELELFSGKRGTIDAIDWTVVISRNFRTLSISSSHRVRIASLFLKKEAL